MANQVNDLGQKFTCFKCECKFYDLGSPEPLCPRCGADQRENLSAPPPVSPKRKRSRAAPRKESSPAVASPATPDADLGEGDLLDQGFAETPQEAGAAGDLSDDLSPSPEDSAAKSPKGKSPADAAPAKKSAAKKAAAKKPAAKKAAAKKPAAKKAAAKKPAAKKAAAKKPAAKKAAAKKKPAAKKAAAKK